MIPGLGRYPEEGKGYPLQYPGLENSMDFTVHRVEKSRTQLSRFHFHFQGTRSHMPQLKDPAGPQENPRWCLQQLRSCNQIRDSPVTQSKESTCNEGDTGDKGSNPGSIRSPGEGNGRGDWQATVHRVAMSQTGLKQLSMHAVK